MKNDFDPIYYAVILVPTESRELNKEVVAKHAEHLRELDADGKLVLAGPFTDHPTGMLILRGENKDEIKSIVDEDPPCSGRFQNLRDQNLADGKPDK